MLRITNGRPPWLHKWVYINAPDDVYPALSRRIFIPLAMGYTHFNKACQLDERLISRSSFINNK
jgi:hypothetical protein